MNLWVKEVASGFGSFHVAGTEAGLYAVTLPNEDLATALARAQRASGAGAIIRLQAGETPAEARWVLAGAEQLSQYLAGMRNRFEVPLCPVGTAFQRSVWRALQTIPYGEVRSYQQIAADVGQPRAVRAVGAANGRNPLAILIPCHRVIGANGQLVGYGGGLPLKAQLLRLERQASA